MYIALTMRKLLEEKGEFKKLAGIPLCVIYNQDDTLSVQDHILLNETKLKEEYMKAMAIGEPSLDIGMMIGDLLWRKADGILILDEEEAKMLQKNEIQRDKNTLYVVTSLKEALELYKKNSKKSTGKRAARKTEKSQEESGKLNQDIKPDEVETNENDTIEPMAGMNPPEEMMEAELSDTENDADTDADTSEESNEEMNWEGFNNEAEATEEQDTVMVYDQTDRTEALRFPAVINDPQYDVFKKELDGVGVTIAMAPYVLTALQISTNVSDFYDCLNETIGAIEDVLIIYNQVQDSYDTFKNLADQIVPYDAYVND